VLRVIAALLSVCRPEARALPGCRDGRQPGLGARRGLHPNHPAV